MCLACVVMFSCKSTQTLRISGKPGTEIYSAKMRKMADIPQSGVASVVVSADDFNAFMYSHEKGSDEYVPFALNYKTDKHTGAKVLKGLGIGLSFGGAIALATGLIISATGGGSGVMIGGLGAAGLGLCVGIPMSHRCGQDQFVNNYSYIKDQKTNQDIVFSPLVQTADYKTLSNKKAKQVEEKKQSAVKNYEKEVNNETKAAVAENKVNNVSEDKSRREERKPTASSIDYSGSVVGTYVGKGRILESGEVTERFNDMAVIVRPYSDNMVKVSVKVSGLFLFRDEALYSVSKSDGMFVLNNKAFNSTIRIDEYGDMSYERKKMDEYGSDGVLKVTAEKK